MPDQLSANDIDVLLAAAVAAPSMHNTQPWRFEIQDHVIDVYLDGSRTLPAEDPTGRAMRIAASAATFNPGRPSIVISASGMATGGRVLYHLARLLPGKRNTVVLPGFQVPGTRGRALLDGAHAVKIHGRYVPVRAQIVGLSEFSAHADSDELIAWLRSAPEPPETVYVVHGEDHARAELAHRINAELGWTAATPNYLERVRL